jgi:two-component system chemotaxis response regulator CheB
MGKSKAGKEEGDIPQNLPLSSLNQQGKARGESSRSNTDLAVEVRRLKLNGCPEIVVVGTSLGGLHALEVLLAGLPDNLPVPMAITQHRHRDSDDSLCVFLQGHCALPLKEAEDKEVILPGRVYLAPADYHLLVEAGYSHQVTTKDMALPALQRTNDTSENNMVSQRNLQDRQKVGVPTFALSTEAPVLHARPSIDALFESAADAYGEKIIGVLLTGASNDGSQGLIKIKANGGLVIVQDPTSAESPTMPKAAISAFKQQRSTNAAIAVDWILPLHDIAPLIVNLCHLALR